MGMGPEDQADRPREAIWTLVVLVEQGVCHSMFMQPQRLCSPLGTSIHGSAVQAQVIPSPPSLGRRRLLALGRGLVEKGRVTNKS